MRAYKIHFIRHGLTTANLENRYLGSTDGELCSAGIDEINDMIDKYVYPNVAKVYSSPLKRCIDTAKLIYPLMKYTLVDDLKEYNFGDFEGKTIDELKSNSDYCDWINSSNKASPPNGETHQEFSDRIMNGLTNIVDDMLKKQMSQVAIITHGGVLMSLLSEVAVPKQNPINWSVGNGKGYTLIFNAQLWDSFRVLEVFEALPYGCDTTVNHGNKLFELFDK